MSIAHHRDADPDLQILADIRTKLDAVQRWVWAEKRLLALKYRPDQLRIPAGDFGAGRFADEGRGGARSGRLQRISSDGWLPEEPPSDSSERSELQRAYSEQVRRLQSEGVPLDGLKLLLEVARWSARWIAEIIANADGPKDLEELLDNAEYPRLGYHLHHIVEQGSAYNDGYSRNIVDAPDNIVRIPTLKHYQITGWFSRANEDFGYMSPRDFLRHKSWDVRVSVGLRALRLFGVLK